MKNLDLTTRNGRQNFYRSKEWIALRSYMLSLKPLCELCLTNDIIKPATEIHHRVDIKYKPHLRLSTSNLQCLCKECHDTITISELTQTEEAIKPVKKIWNTSILKLKNL